MGSSIMDYQVSNCTKVLSNEVVTVTANSGYHFEDTELPSVINASSYDQIYGTKVSDSVVTINLPTVGSYMLCATAVVNQQPVYSWVIPESCIVTGIDTTVTWQAGTTFATILNNISTFTLQPSSNMYEFNVYLLPYIKDSSDTSLLVLAEDINTQTQTATFTINNSKLSKVINGNLVVTPNFNTVTPKHYISQNLTNCISDCTQTEINEGTNITITISPNDGYYFADTPTATMNDVNVDSSQLEGRYTFIFNAVDGDIIINATCVAVVPVINNNADYGFINIYNPTLQQLKQSASQVFIGGSGITDISKYIVDVFKIFNTPLVMPDLESIKYGSYDTTIACNVIREPEIIVDCGSVELEELYENSLDYSPYVEVKIYLPFIGFNQLDTDILMNNSVSLRYTINVLNGDCLATIYSTSCPDTVLYQFGGESKMKIPFSVQDYSQLKTDSIQMSSAMLGGMTPYLLVERAKSYTPDSSQLEGYPSNEVVLLGDLTGFTICKTVDVNELTCTDDEKKEIKSILESGVIL